MEPFEEPGTWWLPRREADSRSGTLRFAYGNDGLALSLTGSFEAPVADPMNTPLATYPIILGRTSSGRSITLEDSSTTRRQLIGFGGDVLNEQISSARIFVEALLPEGSKSLCRRISMNFEHLSDWALPGKGFAKFDPAEMLDDEHIERFEFSVPTPVIFNAFGASIAISYGFEQSHGAHEFSAKRPVRIIATFPQPVPFDKTYDEVVKPLQYFLTFACSAPAQLLDLQLTVDEQDQVLTDEVTIPTWIKAAHRGWRAPNDVASPCYQMLLPLRKCSERVEETLANWADVMKMGTNAIDLLASLSLGPPLYLETRFLLSVQAIEAYARRRFEDTSIEPGAHERRKAMIISGLPDDEELVNWVKELLHWSNEPTLAQRLRRVIEYCSPPAPGLLRDDFVKLTVRTRNWLTHYSEELREKAASGEDLYWLTEEVIVLMECLLLRDLGFDGVDVGKLLESTRRAQAVFRTKQYRDE
jgi:hypothetical protein